ncbi:hypothetical protein FNH09_44805 [Streptomyces adustus]|uniref:Uncharacterized protein n=1 Tax=Streptomyces adustus TaxID=1609272 RepID=A0A5N8VS05_9ACTN|nr:hypothetical protein [Streptomyces adustus]MPY38083.1 hypothetical protein [Streptomyces adustus]
MEFLISPIGNFFMRERLVGAIRERGQDALQGYPFTVEKSARVRTPVERIAECQFRARMFFEESLQDVRVSPCDRIQFISDATQ